MKKVYAQYLRGFIIDKGTRYWFTDVVRASTREDLKTAVKQYRNRKRNLKPTYTKELEYSHKAEVENYHELCETVRSYLTVQTEGSREVKQIVFFSGYKW